MIAGAKRIGDIQYSGCRYGHLGGCRRRVPEMYGATKS